jgi:ABC-type polysaccharide/polyol phosphate transport system ATPase subunit
VIGAIRLEGVGKRFRLFHERPRSLKEAALGRRRTYDEFWALQDVSFQVEPGETIGIIGPNGSGKSTLLKCLSRILTPDRGSILVSGQVGALLELGAGFHPEMTGRENVFLNGAILGVNRRELKARFDEIVGLAELERFIDMPVKNYSSGMYARLGFAVAVTLRSDILLVDEVLAVGDEAFQQRSLAKFAELKARGCTVVLVTHALGLVAERCDRAVLLREGRMADIGPAPKVVSSYRQAVAAAADPERAGPPETTPAVRRLEVTGVKFHGSAPGSSVVAGQPMEVAVDWTAHDGVRDFEIEVAVFMAGGTRALAEATARTAAGRAPAGGTLGRTRLRLPEMAPGEYTVSVSLRARDPQIADQSSRYALRVEPDTGERRAG